MLDGDGREKETLGSYCPFFALPSSTLRGGKCLAHDEPLSVSTRYVAEYCRSDRHVACTLYETASRNARARIVESHPVHSTDSVPLALGAGSVLEEGNGGTGPASLRPRSKGDREPQVIDAVPVNGRVADRSLGVPWHGSTESAALGPTAANESTGRSGSSSPMKASLDLEATKTATPRVISAPIVGERERVHGPLSRSRRVVASATIAALVVVGASLLIYGANREASRHSAIVARGSIHAAVGGHGGVTAVAPRGPQGWYFPAPSAAVGEALLTLYNPNARPATTEVRISGHATRHLIIPARSATEIGLAGSEARADLIVLADAHIVPQRSLVQDKAASSEPGQPGFVMPATPGR